MTIKRALCLIMVKMANADGVVVGAERDFLQPFLDVGESMEQFLEEARTLKIEEITSSLSVYADRFFVALRAAAMSKADFIVDEKEIGLYKDLISVLDLKDEDLALIENTLSTETPYPEPRIMELYLQSSLVERPAC